MKISHRRDIKPQPRDLAGILRTQTPPNSFRCSTLLRSRRASNTHGRESDQNPLFVFSALIPSFSKLNQLQSLEIGGSSSEKVEEFDGNRPHLLGESRSRIRISTGRHRSISSPSPGKINSTVRSPKGNSSRSRSSSSGSFRPLFRVLFVGRHFLGN